MEGALNCEAIQNMNTEQQGEKLEELRQLRSLWRQQPEGNSQEQMEYFTVRFGILTLGFIGASLYAGDSSQYNKCGSMSIVGRTDNLKIVGPRILVNSFVKELEFAFCISQNGIGFRMESTKRKMEAEGKSHSEEAIQIALLADLQQHQEHETRAISDRLGKAVRLLLCSFISDEMKI